MPVARFHHRIADIPAAAWDRLVATGNPFVRHAFLDAFERTGCIRPEWGWQPHHLTLHDGERLVAAAPLYLKGNSRGEFVFDWRWADAWERAGGEYFPKLLCASPWSPVTGPRLLAGTSEAASGLRVHLADAIAEECRRLGLSSVHANFLRTEELAAFGPDWLARSDLQFHWTNPGYRDFADFLDVLRHKKRKNIRAERVAAAAAGLDCRMEAGADLADADWQAVHALYRHTFAEKGNFGVLDLAFLRQVAALPELGVHVATARRQGQIVAMALFFQGPETLYGRYWGSSEDHPALHFELCYYLGIEHCIRHGLRRFEPGAGGMHKMARGFLPQRTHSRHYIANAVFRAAVARALEHEQAMTTAFVADLARHSPFAATASAEPGGAS